MTASYHLHDRGTGQTVAVWIVPALPLVTALDAAHHGDLRLVRPFQLRKDAGFQA